MEEVKFFLLEEKEDSTLLPMLLDKQMPISLSSLLTLSSRWRRRRTARRWRTPSASWCPARLSHTAQLSSLSNSQTNIETRKYTQRANWCPSRQLIHGAISPYGTFRVKK